MTSSFEPFLNADKIDEKTAVKYARLLAEYKVADQRLLANPSPALVAAYLEAHEALREFSGEVIEASLTIPVMVHVAGAPYEEECTDCQVPHDRSIQRCSRCGSALLSWDPNMVMLTPEGPQRMGAEDAPWFPEASRVGKAVSADETSGSCFQIDDTDGERTLERWEYPCIGSMDV